MTYRIAFPVLALLVAGGCSGREATGPMTQGASPSAGAAVSSVRSSVATSPRSGALHATKECSEYFGLAGQFCTITSSNLKQMPVGSRVVYASAAGATSLDSDIVLDPPGPGNNTAVGHVVLDFLTGLGTVTISGGTGKFTKFHASVDVSYLGGVNWAWDGTYSFGKD
jgi:hypothetical protein